MSDDGWEKDYQKGYDKGLLRGKRDGMLVAAHMVRDRAAELFLAGREDEARSLRLMNEMIIEGAPDPDQTNQRRDDESY